MIKKPDPEIHSTTDQRRLQIIEATIAVLLEKGISASSMNDFVRASGLSKGGVYHHFDSKEALLLGVLNHFFDKYFAGMLRPDPPAASALDHLKYMVSGHQEILEKLGEYNALMVDFFTQSMHHESIKAHFQAQYKLFQATIAELIQQGIEQGEIHQTTDVSAIASGIIGVFDGTSLARTIVPEIVDFPGYAVSSALAMIEGVRIRNEGNS